MAVDQMVVETFHTLVNNSVAVALAAQTAADGYVLIKLKNWWNKQ